MAASKQWANAPFTLLQTPSATKSTDDHPAHYIANEMSFAHNAMLRGLNAIYQQAPYVVTQDAEDFLFLAASWSSWVMHHHQIEETSMFPEFEGVAGVRSGSLQHNVEQHHQFSHGLETMHEYAMKTNSADYDGHKLRQIIDTFAEAIHTHLEDEIDTLWAMDSVAPDSAEARELLEIYQRCEAEAGKQDKYVVPPMVLGLCDKTFEGGNNWPKMPLGSAYFVHYLFGRKHKRAWRFLPCDTWGNPRELPFVADEEETGMA